MSGPNVESPELQAMEDGLTVCLHEGCSAAWDGPRAPWEARRHTRETGHVTAGPARKTPGRIADPG